MPEVTVWVDASEVLDDLDDTALLDECRDRGILPGLPSMSDLAQELRSAFYARNVLRSEALLSQIDAAPLPKLAFGKVATHA